MQSKSEWNDVYQTLIRNGIIIDHDGPTSKSYKEYVAKHKPNILQTNFAEIETKLPEKLKKTFGRLHDIIIRLSYKNESNVEEITSNFVLDLRKMPVYKDIGEREIQPLMISIAENIVRIQEEFRKFKKHNLESIKNLGFEKYKEKQNYMLSCIHAKLGIEKCKQKLSKLGFHIDSIDE